MRRMTPNITMPSINCTMYINIVHQLLEPLHFSQNLQQRVMFHVHSHGGTTCALMQQ